MDQTGPAVATAAESTPEAVVVSHDPAPVPDGQRRTGVIWVHGIGTQQPGDSLFGWTQPILDVFAEWRRQSDRWATEAAIERREEPPHPIGENPVDSASVVDPENRWILVDIPRVEDEQRQVHPRAQWLFTEAFWAADVRPPSFGAAASYMLRNLGPVVAGISKGYGLREPRRKERLREMKRTLEAQLRARGSEPRLDLRWQELDLAFRRHWQITDRLDQLWQLRPVRLVLMVLATGLATLTLSVYAALHAIPIEGIRKRVEIAAADTFIVEWFADLAVILDDQAQSAAIRTRLLERVRWLRENGCDDVVLLAHSGGTIVSFASLLRFADAELPVAKLVTYGEAIKLGWQLEHDTKDWWPGNSVLGDVHAGHPQLRWVDVWATYDPAPSGPMTDAGGDCPLEIVDKLSVPPNPNGRVQVESRPVTNLMDLADDHGGYWSNDEGFNIAVIRHLDDARGTGDGSRFFRDSLDRALRIERRRRRVSLLLGWRWAAFGAGVVALAGLAFGVPDAAAAGNAVAAVWALVPGSQVVSGTIDGIGNVVSVLLGAVGLASVADRLGEIGPTLLGALVPVLAVFAVFAAGSSSWTHHDVLERRAIRGERLEPSGYGSARSEAALVIGGLIAIDLAAWLADARAVLVCIVVAAVVAAAVRRTGPHRGSTANISRVAAITRAR